MRSFHGVTLTSTICFAVLCGGCGSDNANRRSGSYEQLQRQELDAERQEFISETQQELQDLAVQIDDLSAKVDARVSVDEEKRAAWSQELFELRQERQRLRDELTRASQASDAEWKEMRGDVGVAVDSLQAGVRKLANDVSEALSSDESQATHDAPSSAHGAVGLCPLEVPGIEARVEKEPGMVSVVVRTSQRAHVSELQSKAHEIAQRAHYPGATYDEATGPVSEDNLVRERSTRHENMQAHATGAPMEHERTGEADEAAVALLPVHITAQDIDDGATLKFVPASEDLALLRSRLEHDVERLDAGRCAPTSAMTMRHIPN